MRKLLMMFLVVLMAACETNTISEPEINLPEVYAVADDDDQSRTYINEQLRLRWHADDRISLFLGTTLNLQYRFKGETGDNAGSFAFVPPMEVSTGADLETNFAVYPYDPTIKMDEDGWISVNYPAEQTYTPDSFGLGTNLMVSRTESTDDLYLRFRNACSYLRVRLYGENQTVKSITVKSNGNECLSGRTLVQPVFGSEPNCKPIDEGKGTNQVRLLCPEPVAVTATKEQPVEFWVIVPPVTLNEGFTVTVEDGEDATQTYEVKSAFTFERNKRYTFTRKLAIVAIEPEPTAPADNELWYTSTNSQIVIPYKDTAFDTGITIVSNTYENGHGVITFSAPITKIGTTAFKDCKNLLTMTPPESLKTISQQAFAGCSALTSINMPANLANLSTYVFQDCTSLRTIEIPAKITSIGIYAFYNCSSLEEVKMTSQKIRTIGKYAFYKCSALKELTLPATVTTIDEKAFMGCSSLVSINLPETLTSIATNAFRECTSLIEVVIPSKITEIAERTYYGCTQLARLTLPESLLTIGKGAFAMASGNKNRALTEVVVPSTVTTVGESAFAHCNTLKSIYMKPTTPPTFGDGPFASCDANRKIYVQMESVEEYKVKLGIYTEGVNVEGYEF